MTHKPVVEMYIRAGCPYCDRAAALLRQKGVTADIARIDLDYSKRDEMIERAQATSVPQIFIDGVHVGGCDELHELERKGELEPMLRTVQDKP